MFYRDLTTSCWFESGDMGHQQESRPTRTGWDTLGLRAEWYIASGWSQIVHLLTRYNKIRKKGGPVRSKNNLQQHGLSSGAEEEESRLLFEWCWCGPVKWIKSDSLEYGDKWPPLPPSWQTGQHLISLRQYTQDLSNKPWKSVIIVTAPVVPSCRTALTQSCQDAQNPELKSDRRNNGQM